MFREMLPALGWLRQDRRAWLRDTVAGLVGALLVIPQAITFAYLAGLPPEYGIHAAIWVTLFACLFGNSTIVGGPNTAVAIMIGAAALPFAGRGSPLYIECVLLLSLMVGLIQLGVWTLRLGIFFQYFSPSAITGITTGVGFLILFSSLDGILGVDSLTTRFFYEKLYVIAAAGDDIINPYAASVGAVTVAAGIFSRNRGSRYFILVALGAGLLFGTAIGFLVPQVESELELLGWLPIRPLPLSSPRHEWDYLVIAGEMLPDALAIAFIGLAQTLVIAKKLNLETRQQVDLNRETFAQGMANVLSAFFSSFAGSGSFNRTAVAVEMGAVSPWSGIVSSFAILGMGWALSGIFAKMPLAVMAGVLFIVGWGMIKPREIRRLVRFPRELAVFGITLAVVVVMGLQAAVVVAAILSLLPFLVGAVGLEMRTVKVGPGHSLEIYGNLFFASLDQFAGRLRESEGSPLILNLRHVSYMDHGAAEIIAREAGRREARNERFVVFVNNRRHESLLECAAPDHRIHLVSSLPEAKAALV